MAEKTDKVELIKSGNFTITCIHSNPIRVEAKIVFNLEHLSYKLLFNLMEIAHKHGFGCSSPTFNSQTDQTMYFLIGTIASSIRSVKPCVSRLEECLEEISAFSLYFLQQLDFSNVDMSMFDGVVIGDVEKMVMIKDIYYNGSWDLLISSLKLGRFAEAAVSAAVLRKFEEVNNKDLSFAAIKVNGVLDYLDMLGDKEPVLN
jgi:hypothetical protein